MKLSGPNVEWRHTDGTKCTTVEFPDEEPDKKAPAKCRGDGGVVRCFIDGEDLGSRPVSPGKRVVFIGAIGHGANAREFYDHPAKHGLVGRDLDDMMERCAKLWGWESGTALNTAVDLDGTGITRESGKFIARDVMDG